MKRYIKNNRCTPWNNNPTKRMVNQIEIVEYLRNNPCKKESEIFSDVYGFYRGRWKSNKKYADCLRRALHSGKIDRVRVKLKGIDSRFYYRYFVAGQISL
jgi:hypothetical protein